MPTMDGFSLGVCEETALTLLVKKAAVHPELEDGMWVTAQAPKAQARKRKQTTPSQDKELVQNLWRSLTGGSFDLRTRMGEGSAGWKQLFF